jgi:DNA-binding XRE family transcriptional regulator
MAQDQRWLGTLPFEGSTAVPTLERGQLRARERRAKEWVDFRRNYLFSQRKLAERLGCARRTIVSIESATTTLPHAELPQKFADLRRKHERERIA